MAEISTNIDEVAELLDDVLNVAFILEDKDQKTILQTVDKDGEQLLKRHTPYRSGWLKRSIGSEVKKGRGLGYQLEVGYYGRSKGGNSHMHLAHLVNYGTAERYRTTSRGNKASTGHTPAQHFIKQTQDDAEAQLLNKLKAETLNKLAEKFNNA